MQSCLEKRSIDEREREIVRSDYNTNDRYSVTHKDALANGDAQGKGTGSGGHTFYLPDCNGSIGMINYQNFDTSPNSGAGNGADNEARQQAMVRSLYNTDKPYTMTSVITDVNRQAGQYQVP